MAIARRKRSGMFGLVAALVGVLFISGAPMVKAAEPSTGGVLPPDAQPLGYSLRDMARKGAALRRHANDLDYYPHTRLQILYTNEFEPVFEPTGCEEPYHAALRSHFRRGQFVHRSAGHSILRSSAKCR